MCTTANNTKPYTAPMVGHPTPPHPPYRQPNHPRVPPNLSFEIDDAEEDWLFDPQSIDFVHARYLFHGIRDWPRLLQQAKRSPQPRSPCPHPS